MPFLRPTLTGLRQQANSDLMTAPGGDGMGVLRRAVSKPLAWALSALAHGNYGHLDWISRQSVPYTATGEYLEGWAALKGVSREPATQFAGAVTWSGATVGTLLPVGSSIGQGGYTYTTQADATVAGDGTVSAAIVADVPGTGPNMDVGDTVSLVTGIAGINGAGAVSAVTAPGVDLEADGPLRTRMLQRYADPSQGGATTDYVAWALEVAGVSRAWCNPLGMGAGTVTVYVMMDLVRTGNAGFPQGSNGVAAAETRGTAATGDQLMVANAIYPLRPATALVYVCAPAAYAVNFIIHPSSAVPAAVDAALKSALDAAFLQLASPLGTELNFGAFEAAIAAVDGMPAFTLESPAAPVTAPRGSLPVRGTVTYA